MSALTRARIWRILTCHRGGATFKMTKAGRLRDKRVRTRIASFRTKIVGTRLGILESILRRSRGCLLTGQKRTGVDGGETLTFSRCSVHKSDFLNWPEIVFTLPTDVMRHKGSN